MTKESDCQVAIVRLPHALDLPLPAYATEGSAGMDLLAAVPTDQPIILNPGERALVPTGIAIALPASHEGQVRPRSGLAIRSGLTVLNAPGTIDPDYRGELKVILVNLGQDTVEVSRAERIAQLIIAPFAKAQLTEVDNLDNTHRGAGGFGSTGIKS